MSYSSEYRAARRALGRPIKRRADDLPHFVAWDGEGATVEPARGLPTGALWRAAVQQLAGELLETAIAAEGPYWDALGELGGKVVPDVVYNGRYVERGEFADLPAHLKRRNAARPHSGAAYGNADRLAAMVEAATGLETTVSDVVGFFAAHPRRPGRQRALEEARAQLDEERPFPGKHLYTLLANSRDGVAARSPAGLSTPEVFDALLDGAARYPTARHVVFGGSYDANMALLSLRDAQDGREQAEALWNPQSKAGTPLRLQTRRYRVLYRPRKMLHVAEPSTGRKVTLWDVWGFFQGTFVGALEKYGFDLAEVDAIAAMKARRPTFSEADAAEVEDYCVRECRLLERLMDLLASYLAQANLKPARWDGAGAVAAALLKREGVRDAIAPPPDHLKIPVQVAYAGGRIELPQLGWVKGPVFGADVASAYPWGTTHLPDLRAGWQPGRAGRFALSRVRFAFLEAPWYPLFYRTAGGAILFPARGEGWYWEPEVAQAEAFAAAWGGRVDVLESWHVPADYSSPFAFVAPLFEQRAAWKRDGVGAEKVLKLALNSLYGKMAQQLGGTKDRPPPYFSMAWAGYVTSATRARLVEAAIADPSAVISFATDGIASTRRLALPDYGTGLGSWEEARAEDGVFAQAGVYWLRDGDGWAAKYRGFDKDGMEGPDAVLAAWRRGADSIEVPCTRFVTLGSALASDELWECWGTWRTVPRRLDLTGRSSKRGGRRCRGPLVPLPPAWNVDFDVTGALSAPYPIAWDDDLPFDAPAADAGADDRTIEDEAADACI